MTQPQLQDLLEAGVHFGHQTRRWNPKMRRFIFAERSGIYLIDLQKTLSQLQVAQDLLREVVLKGENVLFVCTKRQLNQVMKSEAERCGAYGRRTARSSSSPRRNSCTSSGSGRS
jgi:small subunit ribosomal protein S2